uniref:Ig-like domain-containing protein n=1 Tax=Naja naja TaxID=35670 RepID=A0A8C6VHP9_NAJNA
KALPYPISGLLLLLLPFIIGQNMEVTQFPENVLVKAGENLTLNCTVTGENLFRSVQWYKGLDRNQAPIYSDNQGVSNRGVRVIPGSTRDFSINIQNVHPEDAGTYYCVTCRVGFQERELSSGKGTLVSIIGREMFPPSQPVVLGPTRRIAAGSQASFNCSTGGFSPQEITVSWLKNGKKIPAAQTNILNSNEKQSVSYQMESMLLSLKTFMECSFGCKLPHGSPLSFCWQL